METPTLDALKTLRTWTDAGWLRQMDSAFPLFLKQLNATVSQEVLMASAILTHMEGRGHTCLALDTLMQPHQPGMDWPPLARQEIERCWRQLPQDAGTWLNRLQSSPLVRSVLPSPNAGHDMDADQGQPLVLGGTPDAPLLYLRRYWVYEQQVAREISRRVEMPLPVDTSQVLPWMAHLFPTDPTQAPGIDWQKIACTVALRGKFSVITGGPGTGKTFTAARLLALLLVMDPNPRQLRVALAAPTGKAAARLSQSIEGSLVSLQGSLEQACSSHQAQRLVIPNLMELTQRIGKARTVHALLGASPDTRKFRYHAANPLDIDVLIVDETSMIHLEMMAALLQALPPDAKLILLGDKDQLASVEAGAVLGDLCAEAEKGRYTSDTLDYIRATTGEELPTDMKLARHDQPSRLAQQTVMLRKSHRFDGAIGQLAKAVNEGKANDAIIHPIPNRDQVEPVKEKPGTVWVTPDAAPSPQTIAEIAVHGREHATVSYRDYLQAILDRPEGLHQDESLHRQWAGQVLRHFDRFRILCAVHEGPFGDRELNARVQQALEAARLLSPRSEWYVGRPVMVTKNDAALGVFNGDVGIVLPAFSNPSSLRAYFLDGDALRSVAVTRLAHVETAFAMTVHKSQGSEFEHTLMVLPAGRSPVITRQLVYTGITRARQHFSLVEAQEKLLDQAINAPAKRASGLRNHL